MDNQLQEMDLEYLRELGNELYEKEDFFEAIKVFLLITDYFPEDFESKGRLVTCYFGAGLTTLALKQLEVLESETGEDTQEWLSSMIPGHLLIESMILSDAGCAEAVITRLEQYFALGLDEEGFDNKLRLAVAYHHAQRYQEAADVYEEMLLLIEETDSKQPILQNIIECFKQLNNKTKQKESIDKGLELCKQGDEFAIIYYQAAAFAYASDDYEHASDYLEKYKETYEVEIPEDSEERVKYDAKYFGATLALHLAQGQQETARLKCTDWLDEYSDFEPTTWEQAMAGEPVNACIQYLKDANLMFRLAESDFVRSSTPSLEFANKGLAERMRGNDEKAYKAFLEYKRILREQIETRGEDFEGYWKKLKSDKPEVSDFHIPDPDDDVPTQILVDEYIERYGK